MPVRSILIFLIFITCINITRGQEINNLLSYKNINADSYFRLNYENDFFAATDEYYTQGIHLEMVSPAMHRFPLSKLLVHLNSGNTRYGIGIEHNGYTPSSIGSDTILHGDRPFAAALYLKTFQISIDATHKRRLSSALSTGVVGGAAGAKEMQISIHRALNNVTPHGWANQIHDDAIINYEVDFEQQLIGLGKSFSLLAEGMARLGTLSDKASVGVTLLMGYFDSPFGNEWATKNKFRIYAYEHPEFSFVGYDATLQGGLFNRSSPYTIGAGDLNRVVFQNRFGFVVVYQRFYLEYFQSVRSREFHEQKMHTYGGIQIAFGF